MQNIIDVKSIVDESKEKLKKEIEELKKKDIHPKLAVILANNDSASQIYVNKKRKMCEELGIIDEEYILDENVTTEDMLEIINKLNNDKSVDGILVQLPVFKHLDEKLILNTISPLKDVDGFHPENLGKLLIGEDTIVSCTPKGIMKIIDSLGEDLTGKNAVVVGRSRIVGKPIACLLLNRNATVTICHSRTKNLEEYTKNADILIVAVGKASLVNKEMVKEGAIVIDVGINRIEGKIKGDVDTLEVANKAKYITPVPGGVGLTTVLSLMENVVEVAKKRKCFRNC